MAMHKKTIIAKFIISVFVISAFAGLQTLEVAKANFFPGDALILHSPYPKVIYTSTSVPLDVVANVANPTPEVVYIIYSLDENSNVTLTDLNKTTRIAGHIEGSQFGAYLVFENLAEGNHTLKVYSQDASGKQMYASVEFIIDTQYTSPFSVLSPQNTTYTATEVPLTFVCREDRKHDGNFTRAIYSLDGMGSDNYIYENSTLADLSIGNHKVEVVVWTENWYFSEKVYFTVSNQTPTPTQSPSPSSSPETSPSIPEFPTLVFLPLLLAVSIFFIISRKGLKQ